MMMQISRGQVLRCKCKGWNCKGLNFKFQKSESRRAQGKLMPQKWNYLAPKEDGERKVGWKQRTLVVPWWNPLYIALSKATVSRMKGNSTPKEIWESKTKSIGRRHKIPSAKWQHRSGILWQVGVPFRWRWIIFSGFVLTLPTKAVKSCKGF